MNNKQFMKVIKLAWPGYVEDYGKTGRAFICSEVESLYICGEISKWECKQARNKIAKMIDGNYTLANYLIYSDARFEKSRRLAKEFWEVLTNHYDTDGYLLQTEKVVKRLKIMHPEWFDIEPGTYI